MSIAIQTNQLTRDFNSIRAVDQITFEVDSGSLFGFLGPNGSGKTTVRSSSGMASVKPFTASG